jgi:hypothetical protein
VVIFGDGVLKTICPGWPWTLIYLISIFQVPSITGMSTGMTYIVDMVGIRFSCDILWSTFHRWLEIWDWWEIRADCGLESIYP